ncbi:N-acetyltransferase [Clostridiales bacterium F-3ap]|uniref:N-acetyltransferase n=2 Tax=Anaerotalea alkaliphila TaxID=2662126 RepID=A0A7X5HVU9_9FIRM|nr:N-acetyltransferase [Anaerotalea alkaliphila]
MGKADPFKGNGGALAAFRPLVPRDLPEVLELYNQYVRTSTATFSIEPVELAEMEGMVLGGDRRYASFAVLVEEALAGYVLLARYKNREAYDTTAEVTLYLKEEAAGRGIGTQALDFIEGHAKSHGFRALLAVICEENQASIALFRKMGYFQCAHFREVGRKFDRMLDVVVYEKLV